ncbi:hypothetical protein [Synechococcus sp. M16CYN]|uniref:hypothetical protein n=1 Tax=Synechococcus sp. M16CYN TaxID=3103139 RepID=UPI003243944E
MPNPKALERSSNLPTPSTHKDDRSKVKLVLCNHCQRTADNGIRCIGMCVADSDY